MRGELGRGGQGGYLGRLEQLGEDEGIGCRGRPRDEVGGGARGGSRLGEGQEGLGTQCRVRYPDSWNRSMHLSFSQSRGYGYGTKDEEGSGFELARGGGLNEPLRHSWPWLAPFRGDLCGCGFQRLYAIILEFSPGKAFQKVKLLSEPVKTREVV